MSGEDPLSKYKSRPAAAEPSRPDTSEATAARDQTVAMLDVVDRTGDRHGLPYGYLSAVKLIGNAELVLEYAGKTVRVKGRRLEPFYKRILSHTLARITESPTDIDEDLDHPFVESISVEDAER